MGRSGLRFHKSFGERYLRKLSPWLSPPWLSPWLSWLSLAFPWLSSLAFFGFLLASPWLSVTLAFPYLMILDEGQEKRARKDILIAGEEKIGPPDESAKTQVECITDLHRLD